MFDTDDEFVVEPANLARIHKRYLDGAKVLALYFYPTVEELVFETRGTKTLGIHDAFDVFAVTIVVE